MDNFFVTTIISRTHGVLRASIITATNFGTLILPVQQSMA
jgi:hypothetical protein